MTVTVIVPLFNKESSVLACLSSIAAQTVTASRVIVVDDRSTDKGLQLVEDYASRNSSFRVIALEKNGGPAKTRNAGAAAAETDWLAFLDADDEWEPAFLEKMIAGAQETKASFGGCGRVQSDRDRLDSFVLADREAGSVSILDADFWTAFKLYFPLNSSCNLIKRDIFHICGGFPEDMAQREDHVLWVRLWSQGRCFFVNEALVRINKASMGLSRKPPLVRDLLKADFEVFISFIRSVGSGRPGAVAAGRYFGWLSFAFSKSLIKRAAKGILAPLRS